MNKNILADENKAFGEEKGKKTDKIILMVNIFSFFSGAGFLDLGFELKVISI